MIIPPIVQQRPEWLSAFCSRFNPTDAELEPFTRAHPDNWRRFLQLSEVMWAGRQRMGCFAGAGISAAYGFPTWYDFLHRAAERMGLLDRVAPLLAEKRYEHAAQRLWDHDRNRLQEIILETFDHEKITPEVQGVAPLLPFLRFNLLVSTNFDWVLEHAFRAGGLDPRPTVYGASTALALSAAQRRLLPLLKIHGDYLVDENRVFTRRQYEEHYSRASPLFGHLVELFSSTAFLFVGFSLQDRKIRKALRRARQAGSAQHFAILPAASETDAEERDEYYTRLGVLPLWYVGDHDVVGSVLGLLASGGEMGPRMVEVARALRADDLGRALSATGHLVRERTECHVFRMARAWSLVESVELARCAVDQDYADQAVSRVDEAYGTVEGFADAHVAKAVINHLRFNLTDAYDNLTRAIDEGAGLSLEARLMRGLYRFQFRGDMDGALEDFTTVLQSRPQGADRDWIELYVAWIRTRRGEKDALAQLRAVLVRPALAGELRGALLLVRIVEPLYRIGFVRNFVTRSLRDRPRRDRLVTRTLVRAGRSGIVGMVLRWQGRRRAREAEGRRGPSGS
ncbi:MAG TPA: SIR2 family protein [Longimicrobiaceae bacterium]|nr:SIR2 family protein [Longimicrobiaceae bacterium]